MFRNWRSLGRSFVTVAGTVALVAALACSSSPTAPNDVDSNQGTRLQGRFVSPPGSSLAVQGLAQSAFEGLTVYVKEDPAIQTSVGSDGSFTLRGLPDGDFTLVFTQNGTTLGELPFRRVLPNTEIRIVVDLASTGGIVLVEEKRTGIGHGDLEIEGLVQEISPGTHPNEGTLVVNAYTIIARPGQTTIREGNRARSMEDIRVGDRVHVKGVWEGTSVLAWEILLQNDDDPSGNDCPGLNGGKLGQKIVLEGTVLSGTTASFYMKAEGRTGSILVTFSGTPTCVGQAGKSGSCIVEPRDQVNVKGTLQTCTEVSANEVKIQKKGN